MNTLKLEAIKNSGKSMEIIILFAIMLAIIIIDVFVNLKKKKSSCNGLLTVKPDTHMDFCNMPYKDNFFHVVVFDLAHLTDTETRHWKKHGKSANKLTYLKDGFNECMRVLEPGGFLILRWYGKQNSLSMVLDVIEVKPLLMDQKGRKQILIFKKEGKNK